MSELTDLTSDEVVELPVDRLGLLILVHMVDEPDGTWHVYNFMGLLPDWNAQAKGAFSEGLNWCLQMGLVGHFSPAQQDARSIYVTRLGRRIRDEGPPLVHAIQRISVDLHPRLEPVRSLFLLGEYELAAFRAMREVEIRVRELGGFPDDQIGVPLMRQAFSVTEGDFGPLTDEELEAGERGNTASFCRHHCDLQESAQSPPDRL